MALVVLTGGARSGKSAAAQRAALERQRSGASVVVVVFGSADGDPEMAERIRRHRSDRPDGFATIEAADWHSWRAEVPEDALLVLDCLGTLLARVMDEHLAKTGPEDDTVFTGAGRGSLDDALRDVISWLSRRSAMSDTIVVTNEAGLGVVPAYPAGRVFRDALGRANSQLVAVADRAYLVVSGRLLELTGLPADIPWHSD